MSNVTPVTVACGDGIGLKISAKVTMALLNRVLDQGIDLVKTESLRTHDGKLGYALARGQ